MLKKTVTNRAKACAVVSKPANQDFTVARLSAHA